MNTPTSTAKIPDECEARSLTSPCGKCPFSPRTEPGKTGGSDPMVYVGQAFGPFWLPCHVASGFDEAGRIPRDGRIAQCAGAAIYRANTERSDLMPPGLHRLPPSDKAFRSPVELLMHHCSISREEAEARLAAMPPQRLMELEMRKISVSKVLVERPNAEAAES